MDIAEEERRAAQFEKDCELGRRCGLTEAQGLVYDLADKLPEKERRLVLDAIWTPLRAEIARIREAQS